MTENEIGSKVVSSAITVHSTLGPGLLGSVYELCLVHELTKLGLKTKRQVALPLRYEGLDIEGGFRVDIFLEDSVIVEIKAVETLLPLHKSQFLTYLRLSGCKLGYLLNFIVSHMRVGIKSVANGL